MTREGALKLLVWKYVRTTVQRETLKGLRNCWSDVDGLPIRGKRIGVDHVADFERKPEKRRGGDSDIMFRGRRALTRSRSAVHVGNGWRIRS